MRRRSDKERKAMFANMKGGNPKMRVTTSGKKIEIDNRIQNLSEDLDLPIAMVNELEKEVGRITKADDDWHGWGIGMFETKDGKRYEFTKNEDEAERYAKERVRGDLENQPELFDKNWLEGQADQDAIDYQLEEFYRESDENYVYDIESESDDEYPNRLRRELVEMDIITEKEAKDESFDLEEAKEEMVEKITKGKVEEGIEGYRMNFGDEIANDLIMRNIDIEDAVENAIAMDGWQHFVSSYDGSSSELSNGFTYWRRD